MSDPLYLVNPADSSRYKRDGLNIRADLVVEDYSSGEPLKDSVIGSERSVRSIEIIAKDGIPSNSIGGVLNHKVICASVLIVALKESPSDENVHFCRPRYRICSN